MNRLDKMIAVLFPERARSRMVARLQIQAVERAREVLSGRKYEGASTANRLSLWLTGDTSARAEVKSGAKSLRERARDLRRNNPYAARAVQVIATNVVGDGIRPQINHDKRESKALKIAVEKWSEWAETPDCDLEGRMNIIQIQSMIMEAVVESGEIFVIRHRLPKAADGKVPIKLQLLEADYLDNQRQETLSDGGFISQGIEYNAAGMPVAYHFYKSHPGDTSVINLTGRETERIEADRVAHIFRADRPHQGRGVSWLAPILVRLRELDIFQDATLKKQQMAACYGAFLIDAQGSSTDSDAEALEVLEKLEPGTIEFLPPGRDIKFPSPPNANDYPEFMKTELRAVAAGLGITYEALTNDLSQVNFSSGRMGFIEMSRNIRRWQSDIIVSQFMDRVFSWFIEAADFVTPANVDMSKLWTHWTKPPREMIDPSKEVPAANDAIRSGQITLSEILRSRGFDPDTVFEERARELKELKRLGIVTDSDPSVEIQKENRSEEDEDSDEKDPSEDPTA